MKKDHLRQIFQEQLAIEFNCQAIDFLGNKNIITMPKIKSDSRIFSEGETFFKMVTFGEGVVISANQIIHNWLEDFILDKEGRRLFEQQNTGAISDKLKEFGQKLGASHHMYIPTKQVQIKPIEYNLVWYEQAEIMKFYGHALLKNAILEKYIPNRPDIIAVAAYEQDKLIGMAGASADTDMLYQIGIDVDECYRGQGIGSYLVNALKEEIFKRGKIPYYGTGLANIYSANIAINCGFTPSWVEIETKD